MAKDLGVSPDDLEDAADGINGVIHELQSVGGAADGTLGRGFKDLALDGLQLGHEGLTAALGGFCDRWEWGVRTLVNDGTEFADRLGLSAGTYYAMDTYASDTFKVDVNAAAGDPYLTHDQVENSSWHTVLSRNTVTDLQHPDYSAASVEQAQQHDRKTLDVAARDLARNSPAGRLAGLASGDGQLDRVVKDLTPPTERLGGTPAQDGDQ
ncbi:hypothetical protein K7472_15270 [Streptomyces sp. PTM05]|uniref:Uncharacterized protein n=1 Tax=Streptantibioticus parmotrematis TaxID=2873249 RepID=A0ABS7QSQ0_9ACTN|nr:hypothetical protein [Streptantibioticus parmotrematis]MBY8886212.1 hypothetical protein [Streptantibioticus parmotrematis]